MPSAPASQSSAYKKLQRTCTGSYLGPSYLRGATGMATAEQQTLLGASKLQGIFTKDQSESAKHQLCD